VRALPLEDVEEREDVDLVVAKVIVAGAGAKLGVGQAGALTLPGDTALVEDLGLVLGELLELARGGGERRLVEPPVADLAAEAETNLRLANRLRAATLWKWASTAGALALGALALAYRYNLGNLQVGVGQALGAFQKKYGTSDEDLTAMQHSIDALVSQAQQRAISAAASAALKT
jgi:hypothetical protein